MKNFIFLFSILLLNGCTSPKTACFRHLFFGSSKTAYEEMKISGKTFVFSENEVESSKTGTCLFESLWYGYYFKKEPNSMPSMKLKLTKNKFYFTGVFKEYSGTYTHTLPREANNYQMRIEFNIEQEKSLDPNKLYKIDGKTLTFKEEDYVGCVFDSRNVCTVKPIKGKYFTANIDEIRDLEEFIASKLKLVSNYFLNDNLLEIRSKKDQDFILKFLDKNYHKEVIERASWNSQTSRYEYY